MSSEPEERQEQPPLNPSRGRKESTGATVTPGTHGRRASTGAAVSLAPPGRRKKKDKSDKALQGTDTPETTSSNTDEGNISLQPPDRREVANPFGVEDMTNKVICEGTLAQNMFTKRYFVLWGSGVLHMFKSAAAKEKSSTAEELTDRLLHITPCTTKKLKGHWVTFHFDSGVTRDYKTNSAEELEAWVNAGHLLKAH